MTDTRFTLLARVRAAAGDAPLHLELWLDARPTAETWDDTWAAMPSVEQLAYCATLVRVPSVWLEDGRRRAAAEAAKARLACKPNERPLTASAAARGFRACVSAGLIVECLRDHREAFG